MYETTIERDGEEFDISVDYSYYPGCAETRYTPAEPPSIEITKVERIDGKPLPPDFDLTPEEEDSILASLCDLV